MEKTKLGMPVNVLAALTVLMFLFGGYVAGLLCVGYIFLREESVQLKKSAATIVFAVLALSAVNIVIGLLPDLINVLESLLALFGANLYLSLVDRFAQFLYSIVDVVRPVILVLLAVMEYLGKPLKLRFIDTMIG